MRPARQQLWPTSRKYGRHVTNSPLVMRGERTASRRHHLALAAAASAGVATIGALVSQLGADEHLPIDRRVREALQRGRGPRARRALKLAGSAGTVGVYAPVALFAAYLVMERSGRSRAMPIVGAAATAAVASLALKHAIRRPRPIPHSGPRKKSHSFPSGHATRAAATSFAIAYVLIRERMAERNIAAPLAATITALVGISRAYADAHWTTDVIGGWALGASTGAGAALWYERVRAAGL